MSNAEIMFILVLLHSDSVCRLKKALAIDIKFITD